nr:hypothetical protein [Tanacetum cinerariifolium]
MCTKFVTDEKEKVDKYIGGLPDNIHGNVMSARPKTLDEDWLSFLYRGVVSTFLFLEFEEVLRLLLVGSLSSSEADSNGSVISLAISLPLYLNVKELVVRNFIQFVSLLENRHKP